MLNLVNNLINKTLNLDIRTPTRLEKLKGKCLRIEIEDLQKGYTIRFLDNTRILLHPGNSDQYTPDVTITGSLAALFCLVTTHDAHRARKLGLHIQGDVLIAQDIQTFLLDLDIDWEEILSKLTGDVISHKIGNLVRKFRHKQTRFVKDFAQNISEYCQEEKRWAPSKTEIHYFLKDVDNLRSTIDRLEAKLELLLLKKNGQMRP